MSHCFIQEDLLREGVAIGGTSRGPDHGLPNLRQARIQAAKEQAAGFICTAKDWIKLADRVPELGPVTVVYESIELNPNLVSAIEKYLKSCVSS